ncbi:hypothetical protein ACWDPP_31685, partial [Streptomyces sp. NPDC000851]
MAHSPHVPVAHTDTHPDAHSVSAAETGPAASSRTTATATETGTGATASVSPAGSPTRPARRSHPEADPDPDSEAVAVAHSASLGHPGELPGVPHTAAQPAIAPRPVAGHLRPAHHRARGDRRRRVAAALIPGGTRCRNGLFSPSRCWPPAPWW